MDFLERFTDRDRDRLVAAATTVRLNRGDFLIRRGEKGGDIFRVAEGELEVIDTRSQPVVVLDVIRRGTVVGEMAFLDESTRSADVRAADGAVCQRWDRAGLVRVLEQDALFASGFYRVLAQLVSERARQVITTAVAGGLSRTPAQGRGNDAATAIGRALGLELTGRLMAVEPLIRRDRELARRETDTALHNFAERVHTEIARLDDEDQVDAGRAIARELHPYVMRSHLGELALDRPAGHVADPLALAHIDADRPVGDGPLGEFLDAWLLGLPTSRALRERRAFAAQVMLEAVPSGAPVRVLVVNVGSGAVLAALSPYLDRLRGEITCVDGSRESLAAVDALLRKRPADLKIRLVQEDLVTVSMGLSRVQHPPQDVVLLDGLFDHLPERVAASLLRWAFSQIHPGGSLVVTAICPAPDDAIYRFLIEWPLVRRTRAALTDLLTNAGFREVQPWAAGVAGLVLRARVPRADSTFHLLSELETEA